MIGWLRTKFMNNGSNHISDRNAENAPLAHNVGDSPHHIINVHYLSGLIKRKKSWKAKYIGFIISSPILKLAAAI